MVAQASNPHTQEIEGGVHEFKACLCVGVLDKKASIPHLCLVLPSNPTSAQLSMSPPGVTRRHSIPCGFGLHFYFEVFCAT